MNNPEYSKFLQRFQEGGIAVQARPEWVGVRVSDQYVLSYGTIGDFCLLTYGVGVLGKEALSKVFDLRNSVLQESGLAQNKYVEISDLSQLKSISREARISVSQQLLEGLNSGTCVGYCPFNSPRILKLAIDVGRRILSPKNTVAIAPNYRSAVILALQLCGNRPDDWEKTFRRRTEAEWSLITEGYSVRFELLGEDIIFTKAEGSFREHHIGPYFDLQLRVMRESGISSRREYFRILNFAQMGKVSWPARRLYVEKLHELEKISRCRCWVVYGLNPFIHKLLTVSMPFSPFGGSAATGLGDALLQIERIRAPETKPSVAPSETRLAKTSYSAQEVAEQVKDLLDYMGAINWSSEGVADTALIQESHPLKPVFDSLMLIKHDFDAVMAEKSEMQKRMFHAAKLVSIGELAAGVSHEIKNPLAIIIGLGEILLDIRKTGEMSADEFLSTLERLLSAARRINAIVNGLRTFARADSSSKERMNVHTSIKDTVDLVANVYKTHKITIEMDFRAGFPYVFANAGRLQQVLLNLFSNARDAMPNGGSITVSTSNQNDTLLLTVSDTGCGIPEADIDRIFDSFFTTKEVGRGTGLGLSISLGIIQEFGGNIEVASKPNQGTKFTVSLPSHFAQLKLSS